MREIKKVYLIGLGAIGASFGAKLHIYDKAMLKIISDEKRIEKYKNSGIFINGEKFTFNFITKYENVEKADLLIISTKFGNILEAIEESKNHVDKDTIIISLLNGIESEYIIKDHFPNNHVLFSICVGSDITREGLNILYTNLGNITFGDPSNEILSEDVKRVESLFKKSKVPYNIPIDMKKSMWWKFMVNIGVNQASAILGAPYGVFHNIEESREVMRALMLEVVKIAGKKGVNLTEKDISLFTDNILPTLGKEGKTSMLQDMEARRKTEVEMFAKSIIKMGEELGVETPINKVFYNMIRTKEKMNCLL